MKLGKVTQQPVERLSYTISYEDFFTDGDNVQTADVVATPAGLTIDEVTINNPRVKFWVAGGTTGISYKIEANITTADGRILQDEIILKIKEI